MSFENKNGFLIVGLSTGKIQIYRKIQKKKLSFEHYLDGHNKGISALQVDE